MLAEEVVGQRQPTAAFARQLWNLDSNGSPNFYERLVLAPAILWTWVDSGDRLMIE